MVAVDLAGRCPDDRPGRPTDRPADRDPPTTGCGPTASRSTSRRGRRRRGARILRLHLGTASVEATPRRGRSDAVDLPDGRTRVVTLRLDRPIVAAIGDPFVLRVPSPAATAAGGIVLDPGPPVGPSRTARLARRVVGDRRGVAGRRRRSRAGGPGRAPRPARAARRTSHAAGRCAATRRLAARSRRRGCPRRRGDRAGRCAPCRRAAGDGDPAGRASTLSGAVVAPHDVTADDRTTLEVGGTLLEDLVAAGRLARDGELLRDPPLERRRLPPAVLAAMDRLEIALAIPAPPPLGEAARAAHCPPEGVRALEAGGRIVRVEADLAWAGSTYRELEALAIRLADPGPLTPSTLRDETGNEPQVRDGHPRGPRSARHPASDAGRARPRTASAAMTASGRADRDRAGRRSFGSVRKRQAGRAEFDGEPLLWHPIRALAAAGCDPIVIVIGPQGDEPVLPADLGPARPIREGPRTVRRAAGRPPGRVGRRTGGRRHRGRRRPATAPARPAPGARRDPRRDRRGRAAGSTQSGCHDPRRPVGRRLAHCPACWTATGREARPIGCSPGARPACGCCWRCSSRARSPRSVWRSTDPAGSWTFDVDLPADLVEGS